MHRTSQQHQHYHHHHHQQQQQRYQILRSNRQTRTRQVRACYGMLWNVECCFGARACYGISIHCYLTGLMHMRQLALTHLSAHCAL
jgi:hypothetical protein